MPDYTVFGLRVRSELPLPELPAILASEQPDVTIRLGTVELADGLNDPNRSSGAMTVVAPDAARYEITGGSEIVIQPNCDAAERNVRLYLLGSAFGALLHQRGLLPLHANAVEIGGAAFAFMGVQGAGKSTLAAWFHDQGHRILSDDVCAIRFDDGVAFAVPGLPRLRLWQDAIERTGRDAEAFSRSYFGDDNWNKFDVPMKANLAVDEPLRLGGIYMLERGEALDIRALSNLSAAEAIYKHTYRGAFVSVVGSQARHWAASVDLVRKVPVSIVHRRWGLDRVDEDAVQIRDHAMGLSVNEVAP